MQVERRGAQAKVLAEANWKAGVTFQAVSPRESPFSHRGGKAGSFQRSQHLLMAFSHTGFNRLNVGQMFAFHKINLSVFIFPSVCRSHSRPFREPGNRGSRVSACLHFEESPASFLSAEEHRGLSLALLPGSWGCLLGGSQAGATKSCSPHPSPSQPRDSPPSWVWADASQADVRFLNRLPCQPFLLLCS